MPVLSQALDNDSWGLFQVRHHLEVKVTRLQNPPVKGGELDYDLLVDAQGPALVPEQETAILYLEERENPGELAVQGSS